MACQDKVRRINLFGGPGSGKSTTAAKLFSDLKVRGYSVELVSEFVKVDVYSGRSIEGPYQVYAFGNQMNAEDVFLKNNVDLVVSDSPLVLQAYYSKQRGESFWTNILDLSNYFETVYPSINLFLKRDGIPYVEEGRYQDLNQAVVVDREIQSLLDESCVNYSCVATTDYDSVLDLVCTAIEDGRSAS
jgi:nicotinamide riboside kinase